jgi:hypothetical protein
MTVRQFSIRALLVAGVALVATSAPAFAQEASLVLPSASLSAPAPTPARNDSTSAVVGPTRESATVGFHVIADVNRTPAAPARSDFSHGEALMIVGGAALLTGIVVGGDAGRAISVGGAVVGLIGLYQYLQ